MLVTKSSGGNRSALDEILSSVDVKLDKSTKNALNDNDDDTNDNSHIKPKTKKDIRQEITEKFFRLASLSKSVIACRCAYTL